MNFPLSIKISKPTKVALVSSCSTFSFIFVGYIFGKLYKLTTIIRTFDIYIYIFYIYIYIYIYVCIYVYIKIPLFTYTWWMDLLKTDKIFFNGLATTAAVKKQTRQSIMKDITKQSKKQNNKEKLQNNNLSRQVCITL